MRESGWEFLGIVNDLENPVTRFLFSGFNSRGAEVPHAKRGTKKFCSRGIGGVNSESHFSKIVSNIFLMSVPWCISLIFQVIFSRHFCSPDFRF